jgi:peptidoglycan-N-acetylglucosamine deacetylase
MKSRKSSASFIFILSLGLLSCQRSTFQLTPSELHLSDRLSAAVTENKAAKSYSEWHSSSNNPEKIFSFFLNQLIEKNITPDEICNSLLELPAGDLSLFENELRAPENFAATEPCFKELDQRLEKYWASQRELIEQSTETEISYVPRFAKTEVVYRDVSQGYFAVTGDLLPKQVMLTFDDGPSSAYTEKILETLARSNVQALFFALGQQVKKYPEIVKRVAAMGHSIGSHSFSHACLPARNLCKRSNGGRVLSFLDGVSELQSGHQAVYDVLGWVDPFIRFPYGESSIELKSYLRKNGIGEFFWNVDSEDWSSNHNVAQVVELVMSELNARGRGIILFHDIQRKTVEALPAVLKRLQNDGYKPVVMMAKDPLARANSKIVIPHALVP